MKAGQLSHCLKPDCATGASCLELHLKLLFCQRGLGKGAELVRGLEQPINTPTPQLPAKHRLQGIWFEKSARLCFPSHTVWQV